MENFTLKLIKLYEKISIFHLNEQTHFVVMFIIILMLCIHIIRLKMTRLKTDIPLKV